MTETKQPLEVFPSTGSGQASATPISSPCGARTVTPSAHSWWLSSPVFFGAYREVPEGETTSA